MATHIMVNCANSEGAIGNFAVSGTTASVELVVGRINYRMEKGFVGFYIIEIYDQGDPYPYMDELREALGLIKTDGGKGGEEKKKMEFDWKPIVIAAIVIIGLIFLARR